MASDSVVVTISGVGSSQEVTIEAGSTVADALAQANIDADSSQVSVNGATATPDQVVENGDQAVATPSQVKLGR